jgi:hypothetical protein
MISEWILPALSQVRICKGGGFNAPRHRIRKSLTSTLVGPEQPEATEAVVS